MNLLYISLVALGATYALWIFYLAVMGLKRARNAGLLNKTAVVLGYPVLIVGYVLDALSNIFVMTFVFFEIPQEMTVTARLKRHIKTSQGWRLRAARWFVPLLDPFDPSGRHITEAPQENHA